MFVFFLRYSVTCHENPLEIFPDGEATGHDLIKFQLEPSKNSLKFCVSLLAV